MNIICRNSAPTRWYQEELLSQEWDYLRMSDLLFLHNLLAGLERRIVVAGNGDTSETYDVLQLRAFANAGWVHRSMRNYELLREIVIEKEKLEIAQLTGRAA